MNDWQDVQENCQPVDDDVLVDVMFADSSEPYTGERADYWDWGCAGFDNLSRWRLHCKQPVLADVAEVPAVDTANPKQSHGQANLPLSLFSPLGTAYGCIGKLNGMLKYGLNNFVATPVIASIYVDATRRHLDKWMSGQEFDSADGVPHFSAILANIDILINARAAGTLVDDRPMTSGYFDEIEKLTPIVKALHTLHGDKSPHHYTLKEREEAHGTNIK